MPILSTLLKLTPCPESIDYVRHKQQFHLFHLVTEQRHPQTWNLGQTVQESVEEGLRMLLAVDEDITRALGVWARRPAVIEQLAGAIIHAVGSGRRVYVYGCGATGRLAKQMESCFWRPFWTGLRKGALGDRLVRLPSQIECRFTGEMTGGDRALVSSLEGFEDLELLGSLQLQDHGIARGDVVICVTEGGETSSVIGTITAAQGQYATGDAEECRMAQSRLYFVYNNPDDVLSRLRRSARVLDSAAITKINLTTGPQAITGSTRMQATTIETFVLGVALEAALAGLLKPHLAPGELDRLGLGESLSVSSRLGSFQGVKESVDTALAYLARFSEQEADTYKAGRLSTYFAVQALITVFIDCAERSPTFRLMPLDRAGDPERSCWVQVWTAASDSVSAWRCLLGRPFRGLPRETYQNPLQRQVADPYLRRAALGSLGQAGNDQEGLYDFSFSPGNVDRKGPRGGDLAVIVVLDEELFALQSEESYFYRFRRLAEDRGAGTAVVWVTDRQHFAAARTTWQAISSTGCFVPVILPDGPDPLRLRRHLALKMLLNAHSTAVMAKLGRVVGNTMTNVSPSNLKLIGRATYLIQSHVNDVLARSGSSDQISFEEANALLFEAIGYTTAQGSGETSEVGLAIIRALQTHRQGHPVGWPEAQGLLDERGLAGFLGG